jgi:hypothetical protein
MLQTTRVAQIPNQCFKSFPYRDLSNKHVLACDFSTSRNAPKKLPGIMQIYQHPHEEGAILQKPSQGIDTIITFCPDFNVIVAFI